jgi:glycerophosphoryl diester phosphodiesterase
MAILAHRGLHFGLAGIENTMPAFQSAQAAGFGFETDLRLTGDGKLVLFHDRTILGKTTSSLSYGDLSEAHARRHKSFGTRIPVLEDLIDGGWRHPVNLEIKTAAAWDAALHDLIVWNRRADHEILISSFDHDIPREAAKLGFQSAILMASAFGPEDDMPLPDKDLSTLIVDFGVAHADGVARMRERGWTVMAYGAVGADEHASLIAMGHDRVITDDTMIAKAVGF